MLAQNRLALPNFRYIEAKHNPRRKKMDRIESCYLGPVPPMIGEFRPQRPGLGIELFFDGARVSDGQAEFESFKSARSACRVNKARHQGVKVECRYNGKPLDPGPAPKLPNLAGAWCDHNGNPLSITQSDDTLTFVNTAGSRSSGDFMSNDFDVYDMVMARDWELGLPGFIGWGGNRLDFANGSFVVRGKCGG